MNRGAIIDIGSNSVRLIIYHINEHSNFEVIDEAKETIRLGSYLTKNNYLIDDGIEISINVLKRFKEICKDKVDTIKRCVYVGYIWLRGDRMDSI